MLGRRKRGKEEGKKEDTQLCIKPEWGELIGRRVPRNRSSREFSMPVTLGPRIRLSAESLEGLQCVYGRGDQRFSRGSPLQGSGKSLPGTVPLVPQRKISTTND